MKILSKYSFGMGDRFGQQGEAQLKAIMDASLKGIEITPVWNKSNREHNIIGTEPRDVRTEADNAAKNLSFNKPYYVDADHINIDSVNRFINASDFFTIDVASYIGQKAGDDKISQFIFQAGKYLTGLKINNKLHFTASLTQLNEIACKYLLAAQKAGEVYRKIEDAKGTGNFITEISMDEVPLPQTPIEIFFILMMLSSEGIPLQTIAPKFSGRFNKGVDYSGDPDQFEQEFESDLLIIDHAIREFGLPENLKISVHSGSDKFAIYPRMGRVIKKLDKGIHVKTAGTTWLEEVIGLSLAGGDSLDYVKDLYFKALDDIVELCAPYADVIDIRTSQLPSKKEVAGWNSKKFSERIIHDRNNANYNPDMRQLLHVAYKLAAHEIADFSGLLADNREIISGCVYENIYTRHICRLFDIK
jgi:tagaturonate epimerase